MTGLVTVWGVTFKAKCIVLTAGTFLNGLMHVGRHQLPGGRMAEPASYQLTFGLYAGAIARADTLNLSVEKGRVRQSIT